MFKINFKKSILPITFSLLLASCGPQSNIEFLSIDRMFTLQSTGLPLATSGQLNAFFNLPSESLLYEDNNYFMVIKISANINNKVDSIRFSAIVEFSSLAVINARTVESSSGRNTEVSNTLSDGSKTITSTSNFTLSTGDNIERNYYILFEIRPNFNDIDEDSILVGVEVYFSLPRDQSDQLNLIGDFQDGKVFSIPISKRI
jgi:hypothetical protein